MRVGVIVLLVAAALALVLIGLLAQTTDTPGDEAEGAMNSSQEPSATPKEAIFAGGCFWCTESAFELMPGVAEAISGYTGGHVEDPTYEQVLTGTTGHFEAVLVRFDPEQISYDELLEQFWRSVDPTDGGGQFYDRGSQYFTAIFYLDEEQRAVAEASKQALEESSVFDAPIVTQILPAQTFYVAEDYHQDYSQKYLTQYELYNTASGRKGYLEETREGQDDESESSEE